MGLAPGTSSWIRRQISSAAQRAQRLYLSDDAYFHGGATGGNAVYTYDLAPPLEQQFSLFFSGRVPAGGDTDCLLSYGRRDSTVATTGLYRPSGGNTLRLILQRDGSGGPIDFTAADLTVDADYWVDVDLLNNVAVLFIDGVQVETVAIALALPTWLAAGDGGVVIGGVLRLPNDVVNRTTTMEIRAAGVAFKSGQRTAIEALYA